MRKISLYIGLLLIITVAGCKRTKDTFTSRVYHNMVSKFNPLFNGEQALLKAESRLKELHKDDFDQILPVYKLWDDQAVSTVKPDLEKAVEKGSKVIQQHSMMIRNDQKNKYIDDSYLLIGISRFYQKDYARALETFNFIIQEYPDSKSIYEARLWAARCKTKIENYLAAKSDYEELYRNEDVPKDLKADIFASYAQLQIETKDYLPAYQLLRQAIEKTREKEKEVRWLFISGQLQSALGNDFEASEIFRQVIRKGPPYELLFQAQLNRARNYDVAIQDPQKAFAELRQMLKDDKNYDNRDQIYYVMAELAEKMGDEAAVEDYLKKSVRVSTTNQKQKALSYLKLAGINFRNRLYTTAEAYYDSTYINLSPQDPRYTEIGKIKKSLNDLVKNLETITAQDSLQRVAGMSEEDREELISNYIFKLEKESEEALEQINSGGEFLAANSGGDEDNNAAAGGWYFYNQTARSQGITDFLNRFGERKLEDNWRRKTKATLASFDEQQSGDESMLGNNVEDILAQSGNEGDKRAELRKQLTAALPLTEADMIASHKKIIQAYMNVGRIYKDDLKDLEASAKALEELLKRYPDMEDRGRVWYTLYRIYTVGEKTEKADFYKNKVLRELPDSEYAALIKSVEENIPIADRNEVAEFYSGAYRDYESKNYTSSLKLSNEGIERYGQSVFAPKFYLLKAFNLAKQGKKEEFIANLKLVTDLYGDTEEAAEARNMLMQLTEDLPAEENKGDVSATNYTLPTKNVQHKYIVVVPNEGGKVNNLRIDMTDFNSKYFKIDNLNTKSVLLDMEDQIILVSNFNNAQRAMDYYNTLLNQKVLVKYLAGTTFRHFVISSDNFQKFYGAKDVEEYMKFFEDNYLKN